MIPKTKAHMSTKEPKKTNYPDLERLPPTNFWKHLLNWAWNKPRIMIEDLYFKYFIRHKVELEQIKIQLELKNLKIQILESCLKTKETKANFRQIEEDHKFLLERFKS